MATDQPTLVLRHAEAGDRSRWQGDDRRRPLSERGERQAALLAESLASRGVDCILSSPYTRCLQTVEPLADATGLLVEEEDALAEGAPPDLVQRLLRRTADASTVWCSHGDVIGSLLSDLRRRGELVTAAPLRWPKASTWVLEPDAGAAPSTSGTPAGPDAEVGPPLLRGRFLAPPA